MASDDNARDVARAADDDDVDVDSIARRAYERYRRRGEEHGRDQEDWFEAEREIRNERQVQEQQTDEP